MERKKEPEKWGLMVCCPEDAEPFIEDVQKGVDMFNNDTTCADVEIKIHTWKEGLFSQSGNPQEIINEKMLNECHMGLALFYESPGSAIVTEDPGTLVEIKEFRKRKKQVFVFVYEGDCFFSKTQNRKKKQFAELQSMVDDIKKEQLTWSYTTKEELQQLTYDNLKGYYEEYKKNKKEQRAKHKKIMIQNQENHIKRLMSEYMVYIDRWMDIDEHFSFSKQSKTLIEGMEENGSVRYYTDVNARYRTTTTATALEVLYESGLLPKPVIYKMQDWIYLSKEDPCDPGKNEKKDSAYNGHQPNEEDRAGWSLNEGVSVWTTSKAVQSLLITGYQKRPDVENNCAKLKTITEAVIWLSRQSYDDGSWGFQKAESCEGCVSNIPMTALALTTLALFIKDSSLIKQLQTLHLLNYEELKELKGICAKGRDFLYSQHCAQDGCWEYDGKGSITATLWALKALDLISKIFGSSKKLRKIKVAGKKFILNQMPKTESEYDDFEAEVYFIGGVTKYKEIEKYCKFYAYMPYYLHSLMELDVDPLDPVIYNGIVYLIRQGSAGWKTVEKNNHSQIEQSTTHGHAMALSVIATWLSKVNGLFYKKLFQQILKENSEITSSAGIKLLIGKE